MSDHDIISYLKNIIPLVSATFHEDHCISLKLTSPECVLGGIVRLRSDKHSILGLISQLHHLRELDLRRNRFGLIPNLGLVNLESLDLGSNYMGSVPEWIRGLNLKYLNLGVNELKFIPDWIGELPLENLKLHKNQLSNVDAIAPLRLTSLNLYLNRLKWPKFLWDFDLKVFSWGVSGIKEIDGIGNWKNLEWLTCVANKIECLPDSICGLTKLKGLVLNKNRLTCLPERIGELVNLRHLFLYKNQISVLPKSFGSLKLERYINP